MGVYKIVEIGDPILKQKANPVKNINEGITRLMDNLRDTLYEMNGCGLAAPQIGVSRRAIVVDIGDHLYEVINPEIADGSGEEKDFEGCLSIPNMRGMVKRMARVTVTGLNRGGKEITINAEGFLARAFQHEIDHLDGILMVDRAEFVEKADR